MVSLAGSTRRLCLLLRPAGTLCNWRGMHATPPVLPLPANAAAWRLPACLPLCLRLPACRYETANHLWVILEYCVGGDLLALLRSDGRLPEASGKPQAAISGDALQGCTADTHPWPGVGACCFAHCSGCPN